MTEPSTIILLEHLALASYPAAETMLMDGWTARFTGGYTRRANSVQTIDPFTGDLERAIDEVERQYRARSLRVVFKLTPATQPPELEAALIARGYTHDCETRVMVLPEAGFIAATEPMTGRALSLHTELFPALTPEWEADHVRLHQITAGHVPHMRAIHANIDSQRGYLRLRDADNDTVAIALGVIEDAWMSVYDVFVAESMRGRGIGHHLMGVLCAWGMAKGAARATLNVIEANAPARALYRSLGFEDVYSYWYRQKD